MASVRRAAGTFLFIGAVAELDPTDVARAGPSEISSKTRPVSPSFRPTLSRRRGVHWLGMRHRNCYLPFVDTRHGHRQRIASFMWETRHGLDRAHENGSKPERAPDF